MPPDIEIVFPESSKRFVELQANNDFHIYSQPPYFDQAEDAVARLSPTTCLELGAGIGRMSVYFLKRFGWDESFFYLQDGDSGDIQYGGIRYGQEGEFYNSLDVTREFVTANGMRKFSTIQRLTEIERPIDFCYSFAAIGFHWSIDLYLDVLVPILAPGGRILFEVRAPVEPSWEASEEKRHESRAFFDAQVEAAKQHEAYRILSIFHHETYTGNRYRDKTAFLYLAKRDLR